MKSINSLYDLAINGALPAFDEVLHVGRPNIGDREAFLKYASDIFDRGWLTNNGPLVQKFEDKIADHHDVKHCIAMCNGTVALEIAIRALGLGGEVIIPSYTFIATAHALQWQAIKPVFADINPSTHNLDPDAVRTMITPKTTGIIGVHLWGRPCAIDELKSIADEYKLKLMFDAAHAFGCSYKGKMIGSFGDCEVLSFHATKFFNTFEGGAVLTNDDELAETMRLMRNFGFSGMDNVIYPGTNGKMVEIVAAMGLVNLNVTNELIKVNYRNYLFYELKLNMIEGISVIKYNKNEKNNFQYIVVEVEETFPVSRDELVNIFHAENVLARKYFWPGCHKMSPYKELQPHSELLLTSTRKVANRVIVFPTGAIINENKILQIYEILLFISKFDGRKNPKIKEEAN